MLGGRLTPPELPYDESQKNDRLYIVINERQPVPLKAISVIISPGLLRSAVLGYPELTRLHSAKRSIAQLCHSNRACRCNAPNELSDETISSESAGIVRRTPIWAGFRHQERDGFHQGAGHFFSLWAFALETKAFKSEHLATSRQC